MIHKKTQHFLTTLAPQMQMNDAPTYVKVLWSEFEKRIMNNPSYTMRAFSRDLGLSPSHLWRVLFRKRILRAKTAQVVCRTLGLTEEQTIHFQLSAVAERKKPQRH